ncbi:MAG: GNAT family N-acetyltransferase [Desulfovibrio sp.]|nr:MAG: GNAT family N-acetyltransferase [Desulfovibrio sp.]
MYRTRNALSPDMDHVRGLFSAYAESLGFDLDFQNFSQELATLPGAYSAPRGCILLAETTGSPTAIAGCVALRPLAQDICEMKRMFVRPEHRGSGVGLVLAQAVIHAAKEMGYSRMRLDTLDSMVPAVRIYESLGFIPISQYCANPLDGARFYELLLTASG